MLEELTARVKAGAELLDKVVGPDWRKSVDPDRLNMRSTCDCVLGQLGGGHAHYAYSGMLQVLGLAYDGAAQLAHGFDLNRLQGEAEPCSWELLRELWIAETRRTQQ